MTEKPVYLPAEPKAAAAADCHVHAGWAAEKHHNHKENCYHNSSFLYQQDIIFDYIKTEISYDTGMENKFTFRHLLVIILCSFSIIGSVGTANAYGLFYGPMTEIWNVSRTAATLHVTISSVVSGFATPLISKIARKIRMRYIFVFGTILYLICGIIMANAANVMTVNIASVFKGIGGSCISFIFVTAVINNWFVKNRGIILGVILSSSGLSTSVISPLLQRVIDNYGFRIAYMGTIMLTFILCAPFALLVPIRPQDVGLRPYGDSSDQVAGKKQGGNMELKYFSLLFAGLITMSAVGQMMLNMVSHIPSYAVTKGFSADTGAWRLSGVMIGNVAFKLLVGLIIDKLNVHAGYGVAIASGVIGAVMILLNSSNAMMLVISGVLYGAVYSSIMVCAPNLYGYYYSGSSYMDAYSFSNLFCSLFSSLVFTGVNYLYDITGSYDLSFTAAAIAGVAGILIMLVIKKKYTVTGTSEQ